MTIREFNEIMSRPIQGDDTEETSSTISLLNNYCNVTIKMEMIGDNCRYAYVANLRDLVDSDITEEELVSVRDNGWSIDKRKNIIFKEL